MTNVVSKNGMDLIKISAGKLKGKFGKAFVGTLVAFAPLLILTIAVPYYIGLALSVLLFGVVQTGYIRFMRSLMNGENPSLKVLYSEFKTGWLETFLGTAMIIMFLLGGILFIVPGIVLYGFFGMSLFVAEKEKCSDFSAALKSTKEKMNKNIVSMYAYKLFFWILYLVLIAGVLLGYIGVVALAKSNLILAILVAVVGVLVLIILYSILNAYYHAANETFFQEVLYYNDQNKNENQEIKVVEEAKVEAPKAEAKVEVPAEKVAPKAPAKKAPAKTATPKAPAKKTTKEDK